MSSDPEGEDECCLCGRIWTDGDQGWPLCDSAGCSNVVCAICTSAVHVAELFFCPPCSGSGISAAAVAGGGVAAAVISCKDLGDNPPSLRALQRVISNLLESPYEAKFRRLRLANPKVKVLLDVPPARRILACVGFTEVDTGESAAAEPDLVCEGDVDCELLERLLQVLCGLTDSPAPNKPPAFSPPVSWSSPSSSLPSSNCPSSSSCSSSSQSSSSSVPCGGDELKAPPAAHHDGRTSPGGIRHHAAGGSNPLKKQRV